MPPNIRPPFPPNMPPPPPPPPNSSKLIRSQAPNVFSAPPSLIAKPQQQLPMPPNLPPVQAKPSMTFEAKPQIRYVDCHNFSFQLLIYFFCRARQDVAKFVPTVLKVRRGAAGPTASTTGSKINEKYSTTSRFEDPLSMRNRTGNPTSMANQHMMMTGPSTDDAYDTFMKEINQLV